MITPLVIASSALLRSLLEISALSDAELAKSPEFELTGTVTDIDVCSDFLFSDGIGHAFIYRGSAVLLSLLNRIARDPDFTPRPEPESTKRNAIATMKRKAA